MPLHLFRLADEWVQVIGLDEPPPNPKLLLRLRLDETGRYRVRELQLSADGRAEPITLAELIKLPLARVEALYNAQVSNPGDILSESDPLADEAPFELSPDGPRETGLTDAFLRDVARAYAAAVRRGESPNVALARQTGYALKSVQRWVFTARQRGIMPRGSRGRPG